MGQFSKIRLVTIEFENGSVLEIPGSRLTSANIGYLGNRNLTWSLEGVAPEGRYTWTVPNKRLSINVLRIAEKVDDGRL